MENKKHIILVIVYSVLVELNMIAYCKTFPTHTYFITVEMPGDLKMEQQDYPPHTNNH